MPFVRAFLPECLPAERLPQVGDAIHEALVATFDVPAQDRFQVLTRHAPHELRCTPEYLGIRHGEAVAFVQIVCKYGRTVAQKRALYEALARGIAQAGSIAEDDVIVHVVEVAPENWSFGRGLAQLAPAPTGERS